MAHRGNESPMDFQWQTHGPSDPSSPFHKLAMDNAKKRSHSAFTSPGKNNFPSLQQPNGKPYFFNTSSKQVPKSPYRESSFTTPRKNIDLDFSSGPESSPIQQPEEDTPDGKPLPPIPFESTSSPKASEKRNSLFNFYGRYAPSPTTASGRGEIKKPHSDAIAKRIHKRRRQGQTFERQLALARASNSDDNESDSDEPSARPRDKSRSKGENTTHEVGWLTGFFTFIHTYPDAPSIIAKYLQVLFNAIILSACLFMLYSFYATIRADVDKAAEDAMSDILAEMTECSRSFVENSCASPRRPPALDNICANWEQCMKRDPNAVKRARLSAHTFAEIFNSFVEPISLKTMVFSILIVGLALVINNATFTIYRRTQEQHGHAHRQGNVQYPHPTPYAAQMAQFTMTPGYPYGSQLPNLWTPGHIQDGNAQAQLGYDRSPTRDRGRSRSPEKKRMALNE